MSPHAHPSHDLPARPSAGTREIPLSAPDIGALEEQMVLLALRSGRLSIGPMSEAFEQAVAARSGCAHGVAVSSGTTGLHLVMLALGIGPGDEVVTTPFSFVASANAILYVGATPVFVDVCPRTLNADPELVARAITPKTKGLLMVEALGNPAYFDEYARIAARQEIPLIEDCCEALGTTFKGRACGSFGRVGVFGFYPNKQITTGEGGMIVTDDRRLADLCRSMRNQGRAIGQPSGGSAAGSWLAHERLGFNYRLDEMSCALGLAQMRRLDELVRERQRVAQLYMDRLMGVPELVLPTVPDEAAMSWFVFVVRLAAGYTREERDRVIRGLRTHDVGAADYFPCIHTQPYFRQMFPAGVPSHPAGLPMAESVSQRTIALPFHTRLTEREVDIVAQTLEVMIRREALAR